LAPILTGSAPFRFPAPIRAPGTDTIRRSPGEILRRLLEMDSEIAASGGGRAGDRREPQLWGAGPRAQLDRRR